MFEGYRLKDFLSEINKFKEKNEPIEIEGFGFNSCPYAKLIHEAKKNQENKKKGPFHDALFRD